VKIEQHNIGNIIQFIRLEKQRDREKKENFILSEKLNYEGLHVEFLNTQ